MKREIKIINQMVDTLKLHFYPSQNLTIEQIETYNNFVEDMKDLKQEAMAVKGDDNEQRFVKTTIQDVSFHVMARTVKSFSVLLQNGDVSIALKQITDKSANPVIKLEFRSEYLARIGYVRAIDRLDHLVSSFLEKFTIKVSEIHLATDIQGYDFTAMDRDRFKFRNRTLQDFNEVDNTLFSSGTKKTGFSFGKDDFMLRVYDKSHQISTNLKAGYVKTLRWETNPHYDEYEKVWRVEFQFRRSYLKTMVGIDGVLDGFENVLNSIPDLWSHACDRFVHHALTDDQCVDVYRGYTVDKNGLSKQLTKEAHRKRLQRAGKSVIWEGISKFNNVEPQINLTKHKELSKPEKQYVINCFKGLVSTAVKLKRGNFDKYDLAALIVEADEKDLNTKGFSILDQAKLKAVDYMTSMRTQYLMNGVYIDGFDEYKNELNENLLHTLSQIEDKNRRDNLIVETAKRGHLIHGTYSNKKAV